MSTDPSEQLSPLPPPRPRHIRLPDETPGPQPTPPRRGHPVLAWCVIIIAVAVAVGLQMLGARAQSAKERAHLWTLQLQGKAVLGAVQVLRQSPGVAAQQIQDDLHRGPAAQR